MKKRKIQKISVDPITGDVIWKIGNRICKLPGWAIPINEIPKN